MRTQFFVPASGVVLACCLSPSLQGQTVDPFYSGSYSATSLGTVAGIPTPFGGIAFSAASANVILLGGAANTAPGRFYSVPVVRGNGGHIVSFGTPTALGFGTHNDGGIAYGPGGVLFYAEYSGGNVGEVISGSNVDSKTVALSGLGVSGSPGPLNFVPPGFNGAGQMKVAAYDGGGFYTIAYAPDGSGTYNLTSATLAVTLTGGPEGIIYVPAGSPLFAVQSMIVAEYDNGQLSTYTTDANGNPVLASRHAFVTGLTGAEGSAIDPVTGDLIFSTFGGGNQVIEVRGFTTPAGATSFTFTGPTGGSVNSASGNFTVTPNAAYTGTITITPSGGGLATPIVLSFSGTSAAQTFTITPTSPGSVTLTPTNNGSLTNPAALSYLAAAAAVTSFTLTGPTGGAINSASTNFTVTPNGAYTGTITITPSGGGLSTPIVLTYSASAAAQTFTITPTAAGPVTLTPTNSGALTNPAALMYATPPSAPTIGTATTGSGPGSVSVAFTAPVATGGSPITAYTATCNPGAITGTGASSPVTVSGLTAGTAYTCTVTATNVPGVSAASGASNSVTASASTFTLTGPASGAINSASTNFTITPNGPYTGTITIGPSGGGLGASIVKTFSASAAAQTFTITPTFAGPVTLTATNNGSLTNPAALTYATPPAAPTIRSATAGPGSASVAFYPPEINGGAAITLYTATCNPGGITGTGTSSPVTVSGLTSGTVYTCTVTATNSAGVSAASSASNQITIPATGFSFTGPTGGPLNIASGNFTVTPNAPYTGTITITPSGGGLSTPTVLTFSSSSTAQTFTITPTAAGQVQLTPTNSGSLTNPALLNYATPPGAPGIGTATAGAGSASVAFFPPEINGGAAITLYTATCNPGGITGTGASSPVTVSGLTSGTAYTCTVTATNSAGVSAASSASNQITIPATGFNLTGPSGGAINSASGNFTVTPNAPYTGTISITPAGGGLSTPIVLTFSASAAAQTFTITPTAAGPVTLTPSNSGSLTNPAVLTYATPPPAPTIGTATAGATSASVAFTAPATTGGSPVTLYTATCNPGGIAGTGTSSPITVSGLTSGASYTCTVTATNSQGISVASVASNQITTQANGYTLTGPAGGLINAVSTNFTITPNAAFTGTITITLTGGSATSSFVRKSGNESVAKGVHRVLVVRTFTNSSAPQTFTITPTAVGPVTVTPTNNAGLTDPPALNYATPPGPPAIGTATAAGAALLVAFTAPASGGSAITSYTATCTGGATGTGPSSPITVSGLTGTGPYACTVTASNTFGASAASNPSNQVLPTLPPTPAPSTLVLISIGIVALLLWNRRRVAGA